MSEDVVPKDEVRAALRARAELDDEMEPAVVEAFVERIEQRLDQRLAERAGKGEKALARKREHQKEMVLSSMALSIPLLAIAAVFTGLAGVIVVCVALVAIALATAR